MCSPFIVLDVFQGKADIYTITVVKTYIIYLDNLTKENGVRQRKRNNLRRISHNNCGIIITKNRMLLLESFYFLFYFIF